jgi:hypothetical protein
MKQNKLVFDNWHGFIIDGWDGVRRYDIFNWIEANYGPEGDRWGHSFIYGIENLWMKEDVYIMYLLRWT